MLDFTPKERYDFEDLREITHLLRSPGGCPWDQVQTHQSIRRNLLEESYEVCEAIDNDDAVLMQEELGDVLLQVLFHADIKSDEGRFNIDDVCDGVCKKLVFRHPNVFGDPTARTWDDMKALEKGQKTDTDVLQSVAPSLPGLWRSEKVIKKAAKAGFSWPDAHGALNKLEEEVQELRQAVAEGTNVFEELGDVLFAAVCVAAKAEQDPEMALHGAVEKFIRRFSAMEAQTITEGKSLKDHTTEEQLALWTKAKKDCR